MARRLTDPNDIKQIDQEITVLQSAFTVDDGDTVVLSDMQVPAGKLVEIYMAQIADDTGSSVTGLEIELYNMTDSTQVYSTENNTLQIGDPLASGATNDRVQIRVNNSSGSQQTFTALMKLRFEDS